MRRTHHSQFWVSKVTNAINLCGPYLLSVYPMPKTSIFWLHPRLGEIERSPLKLPQRLEPAKSAIAGVA